MIEFCLLLLDIFSSITRRKMTNNAYTWKIFNVYVFSILFQSDDKLMKLSYEEIYSGLNKIFKSLKKVTSTNGRAAKDFSKIIIIFINANMRKFLLNYKDIQDKCEENHISFNKFIEDKYKDDFMGKVNEISLGIFKELIVNTNIVFDYYDVDQSLFNKYAKTVINTNNEINNLDDLTKEVKVFRKKIKHDNRVSKKNNPNTKKD